MRRTEEIHNGMDLIDSRDVIARLEYLESALENLVEELKDKISIYEDEEENTEEKEAARSRVEEMEEQIREWREEYGQELTILRTLDEEGQSVCSDWSIGEPMIRDSYFTEYVMDLLQDIGDLPKNLPWYIAIDEEVTTDNIKEDYSILNFDDVEYFIRNG